MSAFEAVTDSGQSLHLLRDLLAFVKLRMCEAVVRWSSRAIEEKFLALSSGGRGDGPHLLPIIGLLSKVSKDERQLQGTGVVTRGPCT